MNTVNYIFAFGISLLLLIFCDVTVTEALLVGSVVGIFYTLSDISLHLRKSK